MIDDLIDIIESLALIMDEETARLGDRKHFQQSAGMVEAKLRLVAALEVRVAQLVRLGGDWTDGLAPEDKARLQAGLAALYAAAEPNRCIISRRIDLSTDMMAVVASEAQRRSGSSAATYGSAGTVTRTDVPSPISVNTSL